MSSEDWEHHVVNPLLQDMHCGDEEYFNPQEVSLNIKKTMKLFHFISIFFNKLFNLLFAICLVENCKKNKVFTDYFEFFNFHIMYGKPRVTTYLSNLQFPSKKHENKFPFL